MSFSAKEKIVTHFECQAIVNYGKTNFFSVNFPCYMSGAENHYLKIDA